MKSWLLVDDKRELNMNSISVKQVAKHLAHSYGTKAPEVIKLAKVTGSRWPVLGKRLVDEFPYIEAEIRYGVQEYACTIVDFLARRTRLAFLNAQAAADAIPKIADIMAKELNWSKAKKEVMLIYFCNPVEGGGAVEEGGAGFVCSTCEWMVKIFVFHASETFSTVMVSMWKVQSATK